MSRSGKYAQEAGWTACQVTSQHQQTMKAGKKKNKTKRWSSPRFSSCGPESARPRAQVRHSPAEPGWGSPWFRSPRTPSWICLSTGSPTYSNIHSVTGGHRVKGHSQRAEVFRPSLSPVHSKYTQRVWKHTSKSLNQGSRAGHVIFMSLCWYIFFWAATNCVCAIFPVCTLHPTWCMCAINIVALEINESCQWLNSTAIPLSHSVLRCRQPEVEGEINTSVPSICLCINLRTCLVRPGTGK